jgi:polysaccharide export outer membrane protein
MKRKVVLFTVSIVAAIIPGVPADKPKTKPLQVGAVASFDQEYRLGPEDLVEIFVWKEPDLSTTAAVRPDGKISLPLTNEVQASGQTVSQLQGEIVKRLSQYVANPVVNVIIKEVRSPKISVLGEVRKPDVYKMLQKINVLDAIAIAGGFTEYAKTDRVLVIRNGSSGFQRIGVNVKKILKEGRGELFPLQPSDVVYVQ